MIALQQVVNDDVSQEQLPGDRLKIILTRSGFGFSRGSIKRFYLLIVSERPELFASLNYNSVRAWFASNTPDQEKMLAVIEIIQKHFSFPYNKEVVVSWWRHGKPAVFDTAAELPQEKKPLALPEDHAGNDIASAMTRAFTLIEARVGEGKENVAIAAVLLKYMMDYENPNQKTMPDELANIIIDAESLRSSS